MHERRQRLELRGESEWRAQASEDDEVQHAQAKEQKKALERPDEKTPAAIFRPGEEFERGVVGNVVAHEPPHHAERDNNLQEI